MGGTVGRGFSMSLDGFIAGPNDGPERPWAMAKNGSLRGTSTATPSTRCRAAGSRSRSHGPALLPTASSPDRGRLSAPTNMGEGSGTTKTYNHPDDRKSLQKKAGHNMTKKNVIQPEPKAYRKRRPTDRRWLALMLVCAAQLMIVLDGTIVNVALPAIQGSLAFSETSLSWVVNAYLLTFGGFLLLGGRAGDLFGRRRVFAFGLALFTFASLLCGLAGSQGMLVAAPARCRGWEARSSRPRPSPSSSRPSRSQARGPERWASGVSSSPAAPP